MAPTSTGAPAIGYAARDTSGTLSPFDFTRRATGEHDVQFKVLYCGICHTDLHAVRNEWGDAKYPLVPGHEIVGEVTEVGSKVRDLKPGDKVGVGCLVNSCRSCTQCESNLENYCSKGVFTYNTLCEDGTVTYGGYSDLMVCDEGFIIRWPENYPMDKGAPMLCAGITTYSPLKHHGLDKPGLHLGVVGLGGLGHVAVKFGKAFGSKVTIISTSPSKKAEAIEKLKADAFLVSRDPSEMQKAMGTLDGIIDTVSASHDVASLLGLLKPGGKMVIVGVPPKPIELPAFSLIAGGKVLAGSMIGGIKETQEMIDFSAEHGIVPDVEMIGIDYVNQAMDRLAKSDVKYRFVIDVGKTLKKP